MAIFRVKLDKNFTIFSNSLLQDREISSKAKGVLCTMLSFPQDWDISYETILSMIPEGIKFLRSCMKELTALGYLEVIKERDKAGKWTYIYNIYGEKQPKKDENTPLESRCPSRAHGQPDDGSTDSGSSTCREATCREWRAHQKNIDKEVYEHTKDNIEAVSDIDSVKDNQEYQVKTNKRINIDKNSKSIDEHEKRVNINPRHKQENVFEYLRQ